GDINLHLSGLQNHRTHDIGRDGPGNPDDDGTSFDRHVDMWFGAATIRPVTADVHTNLRRSRSTDRHINSLDSEIFGVRAFRKLSVMPGIHDCGPRRTASRLSRQDLNRSRRTGGYTREKEKRKAE